MFNSKCIREKSNVSLSKPEYKFDKPYFDPDVLREDLPFVSPKAIDLFEKITELDKNDMEEHGKLFKHFIFCDVKSKLYGIHFLASCFLTYGYYLGYDSDQKLLSDNELSETKNNNFFLLCSQDVYGDPLRVGTKKNILKKFNERPENVHGKLARFILMDAGFKEGIDLFDIKYIHLFEPSINEADLKQVIGRGTRTCGQKGLKFIPNVGWPLNVYIYDLTIPENVQSKFLDEPNLFALYLKSLDIDIKEKIFGTDLQKVTIENSVDFYLNKNIHEFRNQAGGRVKSECYKLPERECLDRKGCLFAKGTKRQYCRRGERRTRKARVPKHSISKHSIPSHISMKTGSDVSSLTLPRVVASLDNYSQSNISSLTQSPFSSNSSMSSMSSVSIPPIHKMSKENLQEFIKDHFEHCKWGEVTIENNCGDIPDSVGSISIRSQMSSQSGGGVINYTPTQQFVSDYFKPSTFVKGMLLWHSVGTGKTCSAIAAATKNFEPDYTILWVTRATLKNDIWKNMFDQICNESIRQKIQNGEMLPEDHNKRMRMLSKSWAIRPLSYKQFTNLISKDNQYYHDLVKINGEEDPLRKTLLVIDEAHKLYGGGDLSSLERPNMKDLKKAIMDSYIKSGDDSVRLLLMTATPITENPMEIIKLLNLCKLPDEQMPETFVEFSDEYLDEVGNFTPSGENKYANEINGLVSYLNREFDVRQFAQPKLHFVSKELDVDLKPGLSKEEYRQVKNIKKIELQNIKKNPYLNLTQKQFKSYLNKCERFSKEKTKKKSPYSTCVKDVTEMIKQTLKELDDIKKELLENYEEGCEELKQTKEETSQNKLTTYYQLLEKCKQKITDAKEILGVQPLLETIARIKEEIIVLNSELKTLKKTKPLNKEMIDRIQHRIGEKKEFIKNTEEDIKDAKKEEKIRLKEEMAEEKVREKEEKSRIKALEDIEDLVRDGYTMDIERVENVLDDFRRNIERKLQDFV
jgi:hypothetical protein